MNSRKERAFSFDTEHKDVILEMAYDFYGRILATASADQTIKFWVQKPTPGGQGQWERAHTIPQAHSAPIRRLCWAHPSFGTILASCSSDKLVRVHSARPLLSNFSDVFHRNLGKGDLEFAPHHLGLVLAFVSVEGKVYLCERSSQDTWTQTTKFQIGEPTFCLSWNKSPWDVTTIAFGMMNGIRIYAPPSADRTVEWNIMCDFTNQDGSEYVVHDLDWAPQLARKHHLIAAACSDHRVRIFKIRQRNPNDLEETKESYVCEAGYESEDFGAPVWRVKWNASGTILTSTGDDAKVRIHERVQGTSRWRCHVLEQGTSVPHSHHGGSHGASSSHSHFHPSTGLFPRFGH